MALAPEEALGVMKEELRRLAAGPEDLFPTETREKGGGAGYLQGVGFDLAVVLPLLARLPNGAGPSAVRRALEQYRIEIHGARVEFTDRPS